MHHRTSWLPTAIGAAFVAVAVFAIITYINTLAIRESEELAAQAHRVREATQQTLSAMKDAETGQRGFLLTGDPDFLDPHEAGTKMAAERLEELKRLTLGDEISRASVALLEEAYQSQKGHLAQTIALRRQAPDVRVSDEVLDLVKSGRGKTSMEKARQAAFLILDMQEQKLAANATNTRELSTISRTTITIGNLLALTLIAIVGLAAMADRKKRDRAENELIKKQNELEAVVESAFEGIVTCDGDMHIRYMNPAAAEILRVTRPERQVNFNLLDFVSTEYHSLARKSVAEFQAADQSDQTFKSLTLRRTDGQEFLCSGTAIRTQAASDSFTTLKFRDVSETQLLKAHQREYSMILDQVHEAIVVCDLADAIQAWNHGAENLFGISEADAVGQNIVSLLFQDRRDEWQAGQAVLMVKGSHTTEFSSTVPDGREIVIEKRRSLILDDDEHPVAQLLFMIDVTERVREEAKQRRSQRLESIGTLAGGVAHDLNNVLTPILMSAKLLRRGSQTPDRLVDNIVTSAERGARMIQKLLAFAGGEKSTPQLVDVREILAELEEILSHTLPQTIDLQIRVPSQLRKINADSTELSQIIMNLAINARDAMPNGGQLVLEVEDYDVDQSRASRSDNLKAGPHLSLTVSDTGVGIPHEIIERIFEPFFTTKEQGKGTGLGLATTLGIVRSYGGDISVYSELGVGTKFSILLPNVKFSVEAPTEAAPIHLDIPAGQGETLLIVDDEAMIVETAREALEANNYRVLTANGGEEALTIFRKQFGQIDCVLLDMMMPGLDGLQTKDAMRSIDANARIIASSGLRRPDSEGGRLLDIDGFLPKPYSDQQLLRLIRDVLEKKL